MSLKFCEKKKNIRCFFLFSKPYYWEVDRWAMLGDLIVKKMQKWEGKSVTSYWKLIWKKQIWCLEDNHSYNYVPHMCKMISDLNFDLSNFWLNIDFSRICPKFYIIKNTFFKNFCHLGAVILRFWRFLPACTAGLRVLVNRLQICRNQERPQLFCR